MSAGDMARLFRQLRRRRWMRRHARHPYTNLTGHVWCCSCGATRTGLGHRSPLNPARKSGHYVADPASPCWCGDIHFYAEEATR